MARAASGSRPVLIPHVDDLGVSHGANQAFVELAGLGFVTCGSVMPPCGWFPEMAALAKVLEIDRPYRAAEIAELLNGYSKESNEVCDLLGYSAQERGKIAANSVGRKLKKREGKRTPDGKVMLCYEHDKEQNIYRIVLREFREIEAPVEPQ